HLFLLFVPSMAVGQKVQFNRDIRPILAETCFACHGPDRNKRQANLRLDRSDPSLQRILTPGHPETSILLRRINSADSAFRMPPLVSGKTLTVAQRSLLTRWIKDGAEYQAHWAYIPPRRPPVPRIANRKSEIENPIDAFILAKLASR